MQKQACKSKASFQGCQLHKFFEFAVFYTHPVAEKLAHLVEEEHHYTRKLIPLSSRA
jgi:hypothetical protein